MSSRVVCSAIAVLLLLGCSTVPRKGAADCQRYSLCLIDKWTFRNVILLAFASGAGDTLIVLSDKVDDASRLQPVAPVIDTLAVGRTYRLKLSQMGSAPILGTDPMEHRPVMVRIGERLFWTNQEGIPADSMLAYRGPIYRAENLVGNLVLRCEGGLKGEKQTNATGPSGSAQPSARELD
jgi:hypothetical protein